MLYNDDQLRRQLNLPDTQIETDSYIAVQLIESQKELIFDSMRYAAEQVRGYFTFTILDRRNNLFFVKGESPLYLIHFPSLGLYVYSSTKEIMTAAFKQIPAQFPKYEVIQVAEGELLKISPDGKITRSSYTVQSDYYINSHRWFGNYLCGWEQPSKDCCDEDDYMLLLELCGYYGTEPETVQYLRDLGYSYTEIEDFLMYPESYGAELALAEL